MNYDLYISSLENELNNTNIKLGLAIQDIKNLSEIIEQQQKQIMDLQTCSNNHSSIIDLLEVITIKIYKSLFWVGEKYDET